MFRALSIRQNWPARPVYSRTDFRCLSDLSSQISQYYISCYEKAERLISHSKPPEQLASPENIESDLSLV